MKKILLLIIFFCLSVSGSVTFKELKAFDDKIRKTANAGLVDVTYDLIYSKTNNPDYFNVCIRCLRDIKRLESFKKIDKEVKSEQNESDKLEKEYEKAFKNKEYAIAVQAGLKLLQKDDSDWNREYCYSEALNYLIGYMLIDQVKIITPSLIKNKIICDIKNTSKYNIKELDFTILFKNNNKIISEEEDTAIYSQLKPGMFCKYSNYLTDVSYEKINNIAIAITKITFDYPNFPTNRISELQNPPSEYLKVIKVFTIADRKIIWKEFIKAGSDAEKYAAKKFKVESSINSTEEANKRFKQYGDYLKDLLKHCDEKIMKKYNIDNVFLDQLVKEAAENKWSYNKKL